MTERGMWRVYPQRQMENQSVSMESYLLESSIDFLSDFYVTREREMSTIPGSQISHEQALDSWMAFRSVRNRDPETIGSDMEYLYIGVLLTFEVVSRSVVAHCLQVLYVECNPCENSLSSQSRID